MKNSWTLLILLVLATNSWAMEASKTETTVTKLYDVIENPANFADKTIVLEGIFAGRHCKLHFFYKEGLDAAKIECSGFDTPRFKPGTPVRVRGVVRVKQKRGNGSADSSDSVISIEAQEVTKR